MIEEPFIKPKLFWLVWIGLGFAMLAWLMQFYSLLDWEGAIALGVQNDSFNGNEVEQTLANVERGVVLADMLWPLPLTLVAFLGLIRKKTYGLFAALMVYSVCVYFPLFFAFQRWHTYRETAILALIIFSLPSMAGIFALWINRKHFNN